jgi:hypothetical protein
MHGGRSVGIVRSRTQTMEFNFFYIGMHGSVVFRAQCYKPESRWFEPRWDELISSIYLTLPAALGPGVHSASNINKYQKQKNNITGEYSAGGACGWQPYRHLWSDFLDNVRFLTSHNPIGIHGLLRWITLYIYCINILYNNDYYYLF